MHIATYAGAAGVFFAALSTGFPDTNPGSPRAILQALGIAFNALGIFLLTREKH